MVEIKDKLIKQASEAIANDDPINAFYTFFDGIQVGGDMYELYTLTKDELTIHISILKNCWVDDFIAVARSFDIDTIIDDMRYEKRETTINMLSVRDMLENYEEFRAWFNRIADIFFAAKIATEISKQ